ncbi:sesquipedalian-2 [Bombina bombina]|uniref:sesquipedalian-2 n=1 Tax=Bombina bombina TaxID=8345 RepID=UPI00235A5692|nr:sesquipedalian-2 [Bombina bombina]XP_053577360.1 sesquipedalian-2 [Bombina bombina]
MSMKVNERSMVHYATCGSPADRTGYLYKRGQWNVAYQKRWFVLKGNLLFYFEERQSREPVGVVILEGYTVELCQSEEEFAFAVRFDVQDSRSYILAAESQEDMESWVKALSRASFDYMRLVVRELERELEVMQKCRVRKTKGRQVVRARTTARVKWDNFKILDSNNGFIYPENSSMDTHARSATGTTPPPLPPRRRGAFWVDPFAPATSIMASGSPVCPETLCFTKLHEYYGKEIRELRKKWQEENMSHEQRQ